MHRAQYRPTYRHRRDLWSVGCSCGWLCSHPLRGDQERARNAWRQHRAEVTTADLERQMRQVPRVREKRAATSEMEFPR